MQRIAVFSDTHADAPATASILSAITHAGIDRIWCLGDFCSGGPDPVACFEMTTDACEAVVAGNHELFVLSSIWRHTHTPWAVAAYDASQALGARRLDALAHIPLELELREAHLVHGSLTDRDRAHVMLDDAATAEANLMLLKRPLLCFGHTHAAAIWQPEDTEPAAACRPIEIGVKYPLPLDVADPSHQRLLNPGSGCDGSGARWMELRLDAHARSVTWHQTSTPGHGGAAGYTP